MNSNIFLLHKQSNVSKNLLQYKQLKHDDFVSDSIHTPSPPPTPTPSPGPNPTPTPGPRPTAPDPLPPPQPLTIPPTPKPTPKPTPHPKKTPAPTSKKTPSAPSKPSTPGTYSPDLANYLDQIQQIDKLDKNDISNNDITKGKPLSQVLNWKLGSLFDKEIDNNTNIAGNPISLKDYQLNQTGMIMRYMFDFIGGLDTVPGTYIHNSIYAPNPIYNIDVNASVNSTSVLIVRYDQFMFSDLLPSFDSSTYKNKQLELQTFKDKNKKNEYKMFSMNNNALYPHDSNSVDQRLNQYAIKDVNTLEIYNSALDKGPCIDSVTNKPIKSDYSRLFGGGLLDLEAVEQQTLLCDNKINPRPGCFINDLQQVSYPVNQCITGNTSNGKGLHQTFNDELFNPRTKSALQGVNVKTIKDTVDIDKYDNTLGKFNHSILPSDKFNLNYDGLLDVNIDEFASSVDDNTTIAYWVKHGFYDKDDNVYKDIITAAKPETRPSALKSSSQCPQRLDYIMPWTDNLALAIHMQNALYEYYINNSKQKDGIIANPADPHGAWTFVNNQGSYSTAFCSDYWWGWNEIPVIGREKIDQNTIPRKRELPNGQLVVARNEVRTKHWSYGKNGKDFTLAVFIQDDSLFYPLNGSSNATINDFKEKMTTTNWTISSAWKNGGARNSMQFKYDANIKADDPNATSIVLTNFDDCFKNDDGSANKIWNDISDTIKKYFIERFLPNFTFRSCSLVFFRQRLVFSENGDKAYFQKEFFDFDPTLIRTIDVGSFVDGQPIKFNWKKNNQGFWAYTYDSESPGASTIYD